MADKETGSNPAWSSVQALDSERNEIIPVSPERNPRVLAVGIPPGVITFLRQMIEVTIETVQTVAQAQDCIDRQRWALFLFYHRGLRGESASLLSRIRRCLQDTQTSIVYCLGKDVDPELTKRLVGELSPAAIDSVPPRRPTTH